ncbi:protein translocase subunit SecF [Elusimicrobiota bacterium]
MQFLKKTNIDFLGLKSIAFIISLVLVILSLSLLLVKKPSFGIDFTGGSLIHLKFEVPPSTAKLRQALDQIGIKECSIQKFGGSKIVIIRVKSLNREEGIADKISSGISEEIPGVVFEVLRTEMVGPAVGSYLKEKAVKAFIFAFIGMIMYVAWRFKGGIWGFAAVIALIHDVIVTFGILNFLGVTIDLTVVAALLTLAGYSINDSIVVYDRIRENIRLHYKKPLMEVINMSINSTLSRTVITSGTTLMVIVAILLKGGAVLYGFSVTLFAGIIIGTYSSVFVASPLVYSWHNQK